MRYALPTALIAVSLLLSACGTEPRPPEIYLPERGQLDLKVTSGTYNCEAGLLVQVKREFHDQVNYRVHIGWNGTTYRLDRDPSKSGLPRFEDASSGLVWIDLPWKGVLLDGKENRPLANECRSAERRPSEV